MPAGLSHRCCTLVVTASFRQPVHNLTVVQSSGKCLVRLIECQAAYTGDPGTIAVPFGGRIFSRGSAQLHCSYAWRSSEP
jgi:hypothetical protein